MTRPRLEVAADSLASALAAQDGGVDRVELCGGLDGGGRTPSWGTIAVARERLRIPVYVLIRPRDGDFVYDADEVDAMRRDIEQCARLGCDGVVVGALTTDADVDVAAMRGLVEATGPLGVTFHRAFDLCRRPLEALDTIAGLGCERILTSGGCSRVVDGVARVAECIAHAAGRLVVMPGAGLDESNVTRVRAATGATEFHASLRSPVAARAQAGPGVPDDLGGTRLQTDAARVRRMIEALEQPLARSGGA